MYETYEQCKAALFAEVDEKYDNFNNPIVNCEGYPTCGVRTPVIKKLAKSVPLAARDDVLNGFFSDADLTYEIVLFAGVLAARKGEYYGQTREYISRIVPLFRSWAHVDSVTPCLSWADKSALWDDFRYLLDCEGQYEKRFYIMIMFSCCLGDEYIDKILETLRYNVAYGQYYVDMAAAWLLAECLVKYYDKTLPLFTTQVFPKFVHNKAIQKARESFRVSPDTKAYLNTLKVK
ncbi:MAG: DNA alkylation repair protein [Clostridiales bacterium]|nr:DNA alkylation repair protein [Clostridiales bacterium]